MSNPVTPQAGIVSSADNTLEEGAIMRRLSIGQSQLQSQQRGNGVQDTMRMRRSLFSHSINSNSSRAANIKSPKSVFGMPGSPEPNTDQAAKNNAPLSREEDTGSSIAIEGNIGVGKSTFLRLMNKVKGLEGNIVTMPEPVDKWQNVGGNSEYNLLECFYKNPHRYSYTFQSYAFITRFLQHNDGVINNPNKVRILERSVFTDRKVFVSSLKDNKYLDDMEVSLYNEWFEPVLATLPNLVPDVVVYLRASPETCMSRLKKRSRQEESNIELEYLELLHRKHEDWLVKETTSTEILDYKSGEVINVGKLGEELTKENQNLPGVWLRMFPPGMNGEKSGSIRQLVDKPIVIVDCEPHADLSQSVGLSHFNFESVVTVLKACGVRALRDDF